MRRGSPSKAAAVVSTRPENALISAFHATLSSPAASSLLPLTMSWQERDFPLRLFSSLSRSGRPSPPRPVLLFPSPVGPSVDALEPRAIVSQLQACGAFSGSLLCSHETTVPGCTPLVHTQLTPTPGASGVSPQVLLASSGLTCMPIVRHIVSLLGSPCLFQRSCFAADCTLCLPPPGYCLLPETTDPPQVFLPHQQGAPCRAPCPSRWPSEPHLPFLPLPSRPVPSPLPASLPYPTLFPPSPTPDPAFSCSVLSLRGRLASLARAVPCEFAVTFPLCAQHHWLHSPSLPPTCSPWEAFFLLSMISV
nr:serine/threonine-protein kinase WNK2-like isoform X2 [Symphalangus syndactylus]